MENVLTTAEVVELTGLGRTTINRLVREKRLIPCGTKKIGRYGAHLFSYEEVDRFIKSAKSKTSEKDIWNTLSEEQQSDLHLILCLINKAFLEPGVTNEQKGFLQRMVTKVFDCDASIFDDLD